MLICFVDIECELKFGVAHRPTCVSLLYDVCTWDDSSLKLLDYLFTVACVGRACVCVYSVEDPSNIEYRQESSFPMKQMCRHISQPASTHKIWMLLSFLFAHDFEIISTARYGIHNNDWIASQFPWTRFFFCWKDDSNQAQKTKKFKIIRIVELLHLISVPSN